MYVPLPLHSPEAFFVMEELHYIYRNTLQKRQCSSGLPMLQTLASLCIDMLLVNMTE